MVQQMLRPPSEMHLSQSDAAEQPFRMSLCSRNMEQYQSTTKPEK